MKLFECLSVYHDFIPRPAAMNMAVDEAMFEYANNASIRFYRWKRPAVSFGYFGRFADVAAHGTQRDLVRRWTGGGIVFHGDDLTYSIVIPASDPVFGEQSMSIYEKIHSALQHALIAHGQDAELASAAATGEPGCNRGACFENAVRADVLIKGRKVAGAAQRRTRHGVLHQGSIQYVDLGNGLATRFAKGLSENCSEKLPDESLIERAHDIAEQKYATIHWLERR